MALESKFQANLIVELKDIFKGCVVLKNDANYIQGFPDLLVLHNNKWAALEVKRNATASRQPNQQYYVDILYDMSYAAFIHPGNKEEILDELQRTFSSIG